MSTDTAPTQPEALRSRLIDQIRDSGNIHTARVEAAMRAVPRHTFLPRVDIAEAYGDHNVATKRDDTGAILSSASMPTIVAMMLEQLDIEAGHRVLEIGAGTGYNAALLRELVGPDGSVTTVDIEPDAVDDARTNLTRAGYDDVRVLCGDGEHGAESHAPYDRIIVTVGAWDLPPAWWNQLALGGLIVVPLRFRGLTRSIAFDHRGGSFLSRSIYTCGFIPMRGPGSGGERTIHLDDSKNVAIHYDHDQPIDPDVLRGVLDQPRTESWSGTHVGPFDPFDGVWLRLSTIEPATCRIAAELSAVDSGRATPAIPRLSPALVEKQSLAYFTSRRLPDSGGHAELGAIGHGPNGADLADRITGQIRAWDHDRAALPTIEAVPAATGDDQLPEGHVIDKKHTRLALSL